MKINDLPDRDWVKSQLDGGEVPQEVATSTLRVWDVLAEMRATSTHYDYILELLKKLLIGEALYIDPVDPESRWSPQSALVDIGETVRVLSGAFSTDSPRYKLNGQAGRVIGLRSGYATVRFFDNSAGDVSIDRALVETKVN